MFSSCFCFSPRYVVFFLRVPSPSYAHFKLGPWQLHGFSPPAVLMGDIAGGEIQRHGGNEANGGRIGESLLLLKTAAAKTANQKPSTASRWNMGRRHGWDVQKIRKLTQGLHWIISSWTGGTRFQPINPMMSPGENSGCFCSWWFWRRCWAMNCVWWEIIAFLAWRGQDWRHEPGFASVEHHVGERRRIRTFTGGGQGRTQHLSFPESRSCMVGIYPRCRWRKSWCHPLLGK